MVKELKIGQSAAKPLMERKVQRLRLKQSVEVSDLEMENTPPGNAEGEDIVCSMAKVMAGVIAHRDTI